MEEALRWIVGVGPILISTLVYILPSASERAKSKSAPPVVQGKMVDIQDKFIQGLEKDVQQESYIAGLEVEIRYLKRRLRDAGVEYE